MPSSISCWMKEGPKKRPRRQATWKRRRISCTAWQEEDIDDRIAIAETALVLSGDCADAFVLLGDEKAMSLAESRAYFEEGVRAGRRAIGESPFEEAVGHFWGLLETRPYMRARARLATVLWDSGERKSAMEHLEDMLRLNPGDNQGNRYLLLGMLIQENDEVAVERLFRAYPDDASAEWLYDKALWLIVRRAPVDEISLALDDAIAANALVPQSLLGRKRTRKVLPGGDRAADEFEADAYALLARDRWVAAAGALEHLRQAVARGKKARG